MKTTCIIFVLLLSINLSFGQSLSVFDVDASNFPTIKAKFYDFDKDGKQILNLNPSDFEVRENGQPRTVTYVSCPAPQPPVALSSVLVFDVSGSMKEGPPRIQSAKDAANAWIDGLPLGQSECALVTFDHNSYIVHDFTTSRDKLKLAVNKLSPSGGTDYDQALIDLPAGGLQIAKDGKYKKVIVFLTDGLPNSEPNTAGIIKFANDNDITIYAVTLDMSAPQSIKDMTLQTGGQYFENITTQKEAEETYRKLLQSAQGGDPCEIEWQSSVSCVAGITNVEIKLLTNQTTVTSRYLSPNTSITKLEFNPSYIKFSNLQIGVKADEKVTVTARNADFNVTNITSNNVAFTITPSDFILNAGQSIELTVSYLPTDSGYVFARFDIENDLCPTKFYVSGGFLGIKPKIKTLKLLHPNGGEEFVLGSDTVITWEGIPESDTVKLEYTIDNGTTWKTITDNASGLQYIWKNIPKPTSTECKVRIKQRVKPSGTENAGALLLTLSGHDSYVKDVNWSPDGIRLATASEDQTARIWNAKTGSTLLTLTGHRACVRGVNWSPDGSRVVTSCDDKTARIWDAKTGVWLLTLSGHIGDFMYATWSPDGTRIVSTGGDNTARIWDAETGVSLLTLSGITGLVYGASWSPDGSHIAASCDDKTVKIWDAKTGILIHSLSGDTGHTWSPDGTRIATTSYDKTATIWDTETGTLLHILIGHSEGVVDVSWSPDGTRIATASYDKTAKIWDAETGATLITLSGIGNINLNVIWSPDGSLIATKNYIYPTIWDAESGDSLYTLIDLKSTINSVSWNPDGTRFAIAFDDNTAKIWDVTRGYIELQNDESDNVFSIVSPSATAIDIDMKQCLVGTTKDSVVVGFIQNTGSYKFRIDSIYFQGADADAFSLVSGFPKYVVDANQEHHAEFRFIPNRVGIHSAEIVIVTQAETLIQSIRGEGVKPFLSIENNLIDFGEVYLGYYKDSINVTTIKNIGKSPIQITNTKHNMPNDVDFTTLSGGGNFILQSGEEAQMNLRFMPSAVGRTSGTLEFHYNGFGSPLILNLFGEGIDRKLSIMNEFADFPTLLCNGYESKQLILKNTGQTKLTINDIKIINDNESNFSTDATFPFELQTNDEIALNIYFKAENSGEKTALLELISNSYPNPIIEIPLKGKKEIVSYESDVSVIDYKVLMYNTPGSKSFILTNTGTIQNTYSILLVGNYVLSQNIVTLNPNEQVSIEVTYKGSVNNISFNDNLIIKDDLCGIEKQIILTGSVSTSSAVIKVPIIEANVSDEIIIPLILQNQQNLIYSGASSIKVDLEFNPTILSPIDYPIQKIDEKNAKMSIENLPIDKLDGEVLTNIRFRVGLGNAESCKLTLSNAEIVGGAAEIQVIDGTFKLLGICYEGGARLINPNNKVELLQISPNPNDGNLAVELNLIEEGSSTLSIYNSNGQLMYEKNITGTTGKIDLNIDTKEYGNGLYFVSLQTPTIRKVKQMVVFK